MIDECDNIVALVAEDVTFVQLEQLAHWYTFDHSPENAGVGRLLSTLVNKLPLQPVGAGRHQRKEELLARIRIWLCTGPDHQEMAGP